MVFIKYLTGRIAMNEYDSITKIFKVLGDSNRIKIIEALTEECQSVNAISKKANISQPLTSHHLKVLRDAGIAKLENKGTFRYY